METSTQQINVVHTHMEPDQLLKTWKSGYHEHRGVVRDPGLTSR